MDHLIGQRFNLISKSEIRYVGTLHEINPDQSTIALEDVYSFGTEDRAAGNFIPPSNTKFDYIVFRGSDVKDIKIAEEQPETKQPTPPPMPNDPAILNSSRPGPPPGPQGSQGHPQQRHNEPAFSQQGFPQGPHQGQFGGYYPPPVQFGRGFGPPGPPGPYGPGPGFHPYGPPPPGFYGPPGQNFHPGQNQFSPQQQQAPIGRPGQRSHVPEKPTPAPEQVSAQAPAQTSELPVPAKEVAKATGPALPLITNSSDQKPLEAAELPKVPKTANQKPEVAKVDTPKVEQPRSARVTPAIPMTVNQRSFQPPVTKPEAPAPALNGTAPTNPAQSQASMKEASRQAKEAVAAAMAKLNPTPGASKPTPSNPVDMLTQKMGEVSTGATPTGPSRGRGAPRRARGPRAASGGQTRKIEIPQSDFDFETANAKFNKGDLIKEAIATGSPLGESTENLSNGATLDPAEDGLSRRDSIPTGTTQAYNRSTSFFDNISSEARDREDGPDGRTQARALRGQEFKKNLETFGQGNVDGGYRGRGRGGYGGRGRGYGGGYNNRGYNRGHRGRGRGGVESASQPSEQ